ncbi:hypothetical protein KC354_g17211 [Hortaea werneckii]|nr:hypothetical protein KC354_g17211 [Hortaea werneckii]
MAFFGLSQPPKGIFDQQDAFAGLGGANDDDNAQEAINFDDTYAGYGQALDETGDDFNDDTFGGSSAEPVTRDQVGRDFDFAGETARRTEQMGMGGAYGAQPRIPGGGGFPHQQYPQQQQPKRTGYEAYKQPGYVGRLEADASIWGKPMGKKSPAPTEQRLQQDTPPAGAQSRKMMSLEEVEAMMRNQTQAKPTPPPVNDTERQSQGLRDMLGVGSPAPIPMPQQQQYAQEPTPTQILQRPQQDGQMQQPPLDYGMRAPQVLQRQHSPQVPPQAPQQAFQQRPSPAQVPFQQQPPLMGPAPAVQPPHQGMPPMQAGHLRGPSHSGPPITQAQQMMQMTPNDREAYLAEEAKRAKRNHKIHLLSKNNGLMTPQDKNFITRIQLQQLLTATGGVDNEPGSDAQLAEDFYYQVYAQIRGGVPPPQSQRGGGSNFAQTYLFQTGGNSRYGHGRNRNHPRGGDNHVQRMEQQVARAVEAAKARPKNKQLTLEGSLGKIAFSNSKTPRPLLNLKRASESQVPLHQQRPAKAAAFDRKKALRDVEKVYAALMKVEDHERKLPPPPNEESPPEVIEGHMRWRAEMGRLNGELWSALKVMEAVEGSGAPHPFIRILSHSKGKKAIPRVFRHLDDQQRLTMLTLIAIHLDQLDVIRNAYPPHDLSPLPKRVRDETALWIQAVEQPLFSYVNDAPMNIITGLLGLVLDRTHLQANIRTKAGVSFLTMLLSRAELLKQNPSSNGPSVSGPKSAASPEDLNQFTQIYDSLFDTLEPILPYLFPTPLILPPSNPAMPGDSAPTAAAEDVHIWAFLATMGIGASPDQQQRLVLGVKDRVMETVELSKSGAISEEEGRRRRGEVNLFLKGIGLDVELLG